MEHNIADDPTRRPNRGDTTSHASTTVFATAEELERRRVIADE